ncbi:P-loop NTPase fold protein [Magnetococcales bacterium HHB-1]
MKVDKKILGSLLGGLTAITLKATPIFVPGTELFPTVAQSAQRMIDRAFDADAQRDDLKRERQDPVERTAIEFEKLVNKIVGKNNNKKLIICIDDLDRCLPERQVALLEAIHFLTATNAPTSFLIAIDPTLAEQAIVTHYKTDHFNPRQYLDKIFSIRLNLPVIGDNQVTYLLEEELTEILDKMTTIDKERIKKHIFSILNVPTLRNPRIVHRFLNKLHLFKKFKSPEFQFRDESHLRNSLRWIAIIERWPEVRPPFQTARTNSEMKTTMRKVKNGSMSYRLR